MRAPLPATVLLIAALIPTAMAPGPSLAQAPPPVTLVPTEPVPSSTPPAPPPTVLLPPGSSEAPAASEEAPIKPPAPIVRARRTAAILQVLDKSTAETLRFESPVGQPVRFKDLIFTVHVCEDAAPGQRGAAAHLEIQSSPRPIPGRVTPPTRQLFKGWMFANSPGLHPLEHPVYDAWLLGCRGTVAAAPEPAPPPAPVQQKPAPPPVPQGATPPAH
jgi:hypothetical protein